jgi:hypothetical protein
MKNSNAEATLRLLKLEFVIRRGKREFLEVGRALEEIQEKHLYRQTQATYKEYFQNLLGIRERTGAQARKLPRSAPSTDAATAYHEAGHVVMDWCLGLGVRGVSIVRDGDSAGHVQGKRINPRTGRAIDQGYRWHPSRFVAEKHAMSLLAGEAAQRRYSPLSVRRRHSEDDLAKCDALLGKYDPDREKPEAKFHCLLLRKWTVSVIEQHWHLVEAVAGALLNHRELSGAQIRAVIDAANKNKVTTPRRQRP